MWRLFLIGIFLYRTAISQETPSLELSQAQHLIEANQIAEAESVVRKYLASHPRFADAHFLLGYILFRQQKPSLSLAEYTEGARFHAPDAHDLEIVGSDYVLLKDYKDADKWFTKSVEWNPANVQTRYYLGRAKYNENRFEEAVQAFQDCLKLDPKNVKAEDNLGLSFEGLGRTEEAIKAYQTAIAWQADAVSQSARPYLDLGTLLVAQDRPSEALPHLQAAAQIDPADATAYRQLGKAYLHLDLLAEARQALETAILVDPQNAPSHFILSQVYRKLGFLDKAQSENERYTATSKQPQTAN